MRVEQRYSRSYRWCHYLGKYFCTGCHSNTVHLIPARIIHHWDFKKYPVSNFSLDILNNMYRESLFNIRDLNPELAKKIEKLKIVTSARTQLSKLERSVFVLPGICFQIFFHMFIIYSRYVSSCRFAADIQTLIGNASVEDIDLYSLEDLWETRARRLGPAIR